MLDQGDYGLAGVYTIGLRLIAVEAIVERTYMSFPCAWKSGLKISEVVLDVIGLLRLRMMK